MKAIRLLFPLVICISLAGWAEPLLETQPENVGMSGDRLARIDSIFQHHVKENKIPGAVTLVMRRGRVVHFRAYGYANVQTRRRLQKNNLFRIASMTKPITTTALMILYEEGKFLLNDNLSKYLPEFENPKVLIVEGRTEYAVPAKSEIKIRHIMNHTAGFSYQSDDPVGRMYYKAGVTDGLSRDPLTIEETVERMATLPLRFHPGERFHYSMAVDVQGRLIEVLSGMPLDQFFKERLFEPLGMNDTHFFLPDDKVARLVEVHEILDGVVRGIAPTDYGEPPSIHSTDYPYNGPQVHFAGGSGLSSTAEDYAKFCQMLLNSGRLNGARILSRKTVEMMTTNSIGDLYIDSRENKFGLGFRLRTILGNDELGDVGEYSWGGYWHTHFIINPIEEMIIIHMSNLKPGHSTNLQEIFRVLANQAIMD